MCLLAAWQPPEKVPPTTDVTGALRRGAALAVNRWNKFFFDALEQRNVDNVVFGVGLILLLAAFSAGSLASAVVTYFIGAWLGRRNLESLLGPRLHRIRSRVQRSGILAVTAIRLVPIAPLVNMVAGASGIAFSHYIIGTALGLLPGLVMLSAMGGQIMDIILQPSLSGVVLLVAGIATWILLVLGAQILVARQRGAKP